MYKSKKAFTLVELLVVIAILAVLATVSILGYASFTKKTTISNDEALISQWNLFLQANEQDKNDIHTAKDALELIYAKGFIADVIDTETKGYYYAYDVSKNRFALVSDAGEVIFPQGEYKSYNLFLLANAVTIESDCIYAGDNDVFKAFSLYLGANALERNDIDIVTNKGIDTGDYVLAEVKYINSEEQNVVIRTNSAKTSLIINDESQSNINQYGVLGELIINKCAMHSCYINGDVSYVQISEGHLVVNETGAVELVYKNSTTAPDVMVEVKEGGIVHHAHASSKDIAENKDLNNNVLNVTFDYDNSNIISETTVDHSSGEYASANGWSVEKEKAEIVAEAKRKEVVKKYADSKTWVECVDEDYSFAKGKGNSEDPYQVSNPTDLAFIAYMVNKGNEAYASAHYILTCDIALAERSWYPIGTFKYPFHGYIDGNNKTISGFTATDDSMNAQSWFTTDTTEVTGFSFGLIGVAANGELSVKDLTFKDVNINVEHGNCVGAVLGYAPSYEDFNGDSKGNIKANGIGKGNTPCTNITLENITIENGSIYALQDAASIAGKIYGGDGTINITNCTNNAVIAASDEDDGRAAGIVSYMSNNDSKTNVNIIGNTNNGAITSNKYLSGITSGILLTGVNVSNNTNNGVLKCNKASNFIASIMYSSRCNIERTFVNNVDTANKKMELIKVGIYYVLENDNFTINEAYTQTIKCYGTLTINGGSCAGLDIYSPSKVTINKGSIGSVEAYNNSVLNVNGGTLAELKISKDSNVTLNGGIFKGVSSNIKYATIKGGSYPKNVVSYIDNENYHVICNENGEYVVKSGKYTSENETNYEAKVSKKINEVEYFVYYKKVENAFADGSTYLLKDISRTVKLEATAKRYLYTNGYSLTCTVKLKDDKTKYDFLIYTSSSGTGKITINSIEASKLTLQKANYVIKGGSVDAITMNSGTSTIVNTLTIESKALNGVVVTMGKYNKLTYSTTTIENNSNKATGSHTISWN